MLHAGEEARVASFDRGASSRAAGASDLEIPSRLLFEPTDTVGPLTRLYA